MTFDEWWMVASTTERNERVAHFMGWQSVEWKTRPAHWTTVWVTSFSSKMKWWLPPGMSRESSPTNGVELPCFIKDLGWAWTVLDFIKNEWPALTPSFRSIMDKTTPIYEMDSQSAACTICWAVLKSYEKEVWP